jgi:hypothetical protein
MLISIDREWGSDIQPIAPDANFFSFVIGFISFFLAVKITKYLKQIDLFGLVNPFKIAYRRRFDKLENGTVHSENCTKPRFCLNFSLLKSNPYGIWSMP